MDSHPSSSRAGRAVSMARSRLTFSNLTALLALFVALGGSSYAAIRVGSAEIADNSIRSKDIHDGEVRGADIAKDTIRGTDIRDGDLQGRDIRDHTISGDDVKESSLGKVPLAGEADTLGGKSAAAFLGSDKLVRVGPVALQRGRGAHGGHQRPVHLDGHCTDEDGDTHLSVKLESTEDGSFAGSFGDGGGPVSPGAPTHDVRRLQQHARLPDRIPAVRLRTQRRRARGPGLRGNQRGHRRLPGERHDAALAAAGSLPAVPLADDFEAVLGSLPPDWTQLELDLRIDDEDRYIEAATFLTQINAMPYSKHDWHWRLRVANEFGHAAAPETVRGTLALLDDRTSPASSRCARFAPAGWRSRRCGAGPSRCARSSATAGRSSAWRGWP